MLMLELQVTAEHAKCCAVQLAGHRGTLSTVPISDRQLATLSTVCHFVTHTGNNKNALTQCSSSQGIRGCVSVMAASKFTFFNDRNVL